jgi:cell fate (sporulation/competence/biofilm development) regulator YmcA (YheA/YmcA/DUF963 family)
MFPKCSKYSEAKEQLKQYDAVQSTIAQGKKLKKLGMVFHSWELQKAVRWSGGLTYTYI